MPLNKSCVDVVLLICCRFCNVIRLSAVLVSVMITTLFVSSSDCCRFLLVFVFLMTL